MPKFFQPKSAQRSGVQVAFASGRQLDAGITANATTRIPIASPFRKSFIERVTAQVITVPADADGTILATLKKISGGTTTSLSAALDLETLVTLVTKLFTLSTLTEMQQTLREGDILVVDVVNNSAAIDTQPVGLIFTAELLPLE
jgi:hypothetical protein